MPLAANALTTKTRFASLMGLSLASLDVDRLESTINAVSAAAERLTGRKFGFRRYSADAPLLVEAQACPELYLRYFPIRSILSIVMDGETLTVSEGLPTPDGLGTVWRLDGNDERGILWRSWGWPGYQGPIKIAGDFGYVLPQYAGDTDATHNPEGVEESDIDPELERIVCEEVRGRWSAPARKGIKAETSPGGQKVEFFGAGGSVADRDAELKLALADWCLPSAWWAG